MIPDGQSSCQAVVVILQLVFPLHSLMCIKERASVVQVSPEVNINFIIFSVSEILTLFSTDLGQMTFKTFFTS